MLFVLFYCIPNSSQIWSPFNEFSQTMQSSLTDLCKTVGFLQISFNNLQDAKNQCSSIHGNAVAIGQSWNIFQDFQEWWMLWMKKFNVDLCEYQPVSTHSKWTYFFNISHNNISDKIYICRTDYSNFFILCSAAINPKVSNEREVLTKMENFKNMVTIWETCCLGSWLLLVWFFASLILTKPKKVA